MSALVTDQFRILNASNFVDSVGDTSNAYYITVGLPNPTIVGYGRSNTWNTNPPAPIDNLAYNKPIIACTKGCVNIDCKVPSM